MRAARSGHAARSGLQLIEEIDAHGLQRRQKARDDTRADGQEQRKSQRSAVKRDVGPSGHIARDALGHGDHADSEDNLGNEHATRGSHQPEQDIFGQQLAGEPTAGGPERRAHRDLRTAGDAARELEVRHVGADDQKDKERGSQNEPEIHRRVFAVDGVEQGLYPNGPRPVGGGISAGETPRDG